MRVGLPPKGEKRRSKEERAPKHYQTPYALAFDNPQNTLLEETLSVQTKGKKKKR
jgi:hypothetical protein